MKRFLFILLLALILTGCKNSGYGFEIEGELPDIGSFSMTQVKEYYDNNTTQKFVCGADYGKILPFIGNGKEFSPAEWEADFGYDYYSYGFCTLDGKIIADVNPKISSVRYIKSNDSFGVYVVIKQAENKTFADFADSKAFVISHDGSWKIDLGLNGGVNLIRDGYIFVRSFDNGVENPAVIKVYDYEGNHVFTFDENLIFMNYTNSLILVRDRQEDKYYFLNKNGEKVLGPYKKTYPFNSDGFTYVTDESGKMCIVDANGTKIADGDWYNIESQCNDSETKSAFICYRSDELSKADIYSSKGEYIATVSSEREYIENILLYFSDNNGIIYTYDNWASNWKYLNDGKRFVSAEMNVCPNSLEAYADDRYFFYRNDISENGIVFDESGNTVVKSEHMNYVIGVSESRGIVIYTSVENGEDILHVYDINNKKDVVSICGSDAYASFAETENERYLYITHGGRAYLYDIEKQDCIFENAECIDVTEIDGKVFFSVVTSKTSTLYNESKDVLIRFFTND